MSTAWAGRRRSDFFGLTRFHVPSARSSQACELSARSVFRIDSISFRTWASSTGITTLDPVLEIAWHQVGAAEQVGPIVAGLEAVEPAVLEEAA